MTSISEGLLHQQLLHGRLRTSARIVFALIFLLASILHFTSTATEEKLIPAMLPWKHEAVYLSGILEIAGALGLLVPHSRYYRPAGYFLIALLIAVFPANLNHAISDIQLGVPFMDSPVYKWLRLPFQFLLIWGILWSISPPLSRLPVTEEARNL